MDLQPYERDFQREVLKKLRTLPKSWFVKLNDRTTVGLPDIVGCICGVFVALELKTKSKVTALQAYTLGKIDHARGLAYVVTPETWGEVWTFLQRIAAKSGAEDA
jgi:hypothetical protein